jgi:hypothetical protein
MMVVGPLIYGKSLWQAADQKKTVLHFYLLPLCGEPTGGEKLMCLLSQWQPLVKL